MNNLRIGDLVKITPQNGDIFNVFTGNILDIYEEEDGQLPIITITVKNIEDNKTYNVDISQCNSIK